MLTATSSDRNDIRLPCSSVLGNEYDSYVDNKIILDLLNVFSATYYFDVGTKAKATGRNISIFIPVHEDNLATWNQCKDLVEELLNFVTEADHDFWRVEYYPVRYILPQRQLEFDGINTQAYDNVSLLSGGLDSFCGIHENQLNGKTVLYCGYKTNTIDASYISRVYPFAKKINPKSHLCLYNKVDVVKVNHTQRTRSLLFFSLACFSAAWRNVNSIMVYENGTMSLNPSFESRGTTKTTHPRTIYLFQSLLNHLSIDVQILHPFLFQTKGEMVARLPEEYLENIKNTRSCSRSLQDTRYAKKGVNGCGACVPCLLRKVSLSAYDLESYDHEYSIPYNNRSYDEEYCSAVSYFRRFSKAIDDGTIFASLGIRKAYYTIDDYYERTDLMLQKFNKELGIFFKKYGG